MTILEIIGKIMAALDEVTSSNLVANSADYIDKIYPFIDTVQNEIATTIKPIKKYVMATSVNKRIDMPVDCFEFNKVYDTDMTPIRFLLYDNKIFMIEEDEDGSYMLYYNKYPDKVDKDTINSYTLEIDKDCQEALVYGVCANLCINDEPELYDTYNDKYNTMLSNIVARLQNNTTATLIGGLRL